MISKIAQRKKGKYGIAYEDAKVYMIDNTIYIKQGIHIMEVLLAHFNKV